MPLELEQNGPICGSNFASRYGASSPVVSVLDGATVEVLPNTRPKRIRLSGIDCSEKGILTGAQHVIVSNIDQTGHLD